MQNVEAFGIGFHKAIFDAVMNHFDEMAGTDGTAMQIAALNCPAGRPARRAGNRARPRRQDIEDRIEVLNGGGFATDHHAIAAFQTPYAAAGTDIDIIDASLLEGLRAANVVAIKTVAAVDDDIARLHRCAELQNRLFGDLAGREHDPDGARRDTCRQPFPVTDHHADVLQGVAIGVVLRHIGEKGAVIAVMGARQMRFQRTDQRRAIAGLLQNLAVVLVREEFDAVLFEQRRFRRQRTARLIDLHELARLDLAGFDVGLIERIDAQIAPATAVAISQRKNS